MVNCILQRGSPGYMIVTLLMFSGLEDPWWVVDRSVFNESDYQLIQSLGYSPEWIPSRLGYKGFLVKVEGREFLVVGNDTERVRLQHVLLGTMPNCLLHAPSFYPIVIIIRIEIFNIRIEIIIRIYDIFRYRKPIKLALWNGNANTLVNNNCYNYANDKMTNSYAQPGKGSGQKFKRLDDVRDAARRDGLTDLNPQPAAGDPVPAAPQGQHLVALFIWPGVDFHWYRLDDSGFWCHKPGRSRITPLDNNGTLITDPRKAAVKPYVFVAFMTTDRNNVTIK